MYSSFVLLAMVLSILISYFFIYGLAFFNLFFRWSIWIRALFNCAHGPASPRGKAKRKRCSGFLWSWTRSPLGNECWKLFDDMFLSLWSSCFTPLSARFLSCACLVPSSLMAFLYPFTLKGSEWSQAQSDPQQPKEALFDLLLKWWLTCNISFANLG